jgi:hypothetical protein
MKNKYLQTIVTGCAWCKRVIGVSTNEVEKRDKEQFLLLSHGICKKCNEVFDCEDEKSEDSSEEDLVFA